MLKQFVLFSGIALLSACAREAADIMQSGTVVSVGGLRGRWAGPVSPLAQGCGTATTGLATIGGGEFSFDPFQGSTVIKGKVDDDGKMMGTLTRALASQPALSITFSGSAVSDPADGQMIEGTLASGRCEWSVKLKRA